MRSTVVIVGIGPICTQLSAFLRRAHGIQCENVNFDSAVSVFHNNSAATCITVACTGYSKTSIHFLHAMRAAGLQNPRILVVEHSTEQLAVEALRSGAHEYLVWPVSADDLIAACQRCARATPALERSAPTLSGQIIGRSPAIRTALARLHRLASTDCPVLITGETGTGKELAAQLLHAESSRASAPLVTLNCAAIPEPLLESELFGHERGAFTGAHERRNGALADANHGTVMLDEIGDMEPLAQAKILRAVETRSIQRLGSSRAIPVDVRLVACTHRDLRQRVAQGLFREDLYYRLQVARVHLPPLRERTEDIVPIVDSMLESLHSKYPGQCHTMSRELMRLLQAYAWPGNVRELKNLLESLYLFADRPQMTPDDLPPEYRTLFGCNEPVTERDQLLFVLRSTDWNKALAARKLQCSRMTLYRKMAKHKLLDDSGRRASAAAGA